MQALSYRGLCAYRHQRAGWGGAQLRPRRVGWRGASPTGAVFSLRRVILKGRFGAMLSLQEYILGIVQAVLPPVRYLKYAPLQPSGWSALLDVSVDVVLCNKVDDYFRARYRTARYDLVIIPA